MLDEKKIKKLLKEMYLISLTTVPDEVLQYLKKIIINSDNSRERSIAKIMLENASLAEKNRCLVCQDSGLPVFFLKIGETNPLILRLARLISDVVSQVSLEIPLRCMAVDPITRKELRDDNIGVGVPILHWDIDPKFSGIEIISVPKGAGSGSWGRIKIFTPDAKREEIDKFIIETVLRAGSNPCPPVIVGVGIGANFDEVPKLAAKACLRGLNTPHPETRFKEWEKELFSKINQLGIGLMGLGGENTALAVNIEYTYTHKPWLPVAVNLQCWPDRKATLRIYNDGSYELFKGARLDG